jgi:alanine-synthesizing transaminase
MEDFHRIRRLPPYVFEQVNRAKAAARNAGADIVDLGMGNPDLPAPQHVLDKLKETLGKPRTDRYSSSKGVPGLRRAQAAYYERRFGVKLNPETQIVTTLGSKEGFANVAQAITAPGDVVLVPNPSYPIHAFGFLMAGGVIRSVPSEPNPQFFESLERAVVHSIPKPIAVVVCYPANPTAYVADLDFYRDLVAFAKKHGIMVLSDLAYAEVYFDNNPPPSILQVPGAFDVAVEFTSMSKTFSMPGWRIGFAVGNERIIAALTRVKSYLDYGAFTPVQVAATAALNGPDDCVREMRETYRKRRDAMVESFERAGWHVPAPRRFRSRSGRSAAWNSPSSWSRRPRSRSRPASASGSMATITCASRSSRTSSASARPRATSAASSKAVPGHCTTSFLSPRAASRRSFFGIFEWLRHSEWVSPA